MVLDQPIDDEIVENGEKSDELGQLQIRPLLQMVLQESARCTNSAIGSVVSDTVRDTELYSDCPRSRISR